MYDVIVIGGGVIGCAVARQLSKYVGDVALLERAQDVSEGASKANSGIVHAGYDAEPGSDKARLNVKGARMYPALCRELGVPYGQPGALVLGFDEADRSKIEKLYQQSLQNGVDGCRIIGRDEILALEPNINPEVLMALHVPSSGLASPYEVTHALANAACDNGVSFIMETEVLDMQPISGGWQVKTNKGSFETCAFVNCAGVYGAYLHNMMSSRKFTMIPRRGQYYLMDRDNTLGFTMTIFQVPTAMGKGVLISPTTHGNLLIGPTAEDIDDPEDAGTTAEGLADVLKKAARTWPGINVRSVITNFSGIRAHEAGGDFVIGAVEGAADGAFEAIGIESPGLSAAPAIGEELGDWVAYSLQLPRKAFMPPVRSKLKAFSHMNMMERKEAYSRDPDYGRIVCRCETVTEAEVRAAIREPVGARNLDGIKRRTRAGMGRCQGGFCGPRVVQLLCEELGLKPEQVTKFGGKSQILLGKLEDAWKEENV
jgi:glycerol-3-phosphate dehydrogenase